MSMTPPRSLICIGCKKQPGAIAEYVEMARTEGYDSAADFVEAEEGTFNSENGHFLCTECYIASGMPSSSHGWVAP